MTPTSCCIVDTPVLNLQWGFLPGPDTFLVERVVVLQGHQGSSEEAEVDRKVTSQGFATDDTVGTITSQVPQNIRFIYYFLFFLDRQKHRQTSRNRYGLTLPQSRGRGRSLSGFHLSVLHPLSLSLSLLLTPASRTKSK